MAERTGPVQAEDRAGEQAAQAVYSEFIRHTQQCPSCRTEGVDCTTAAGLRQAWRDARQQVTT